MKKKINLKETFSIIKESGKEWMDDGAFDLAAVVAYYAIFSLPSLLIIIISVAGFVFGKEAVSGQLQSQIGSMLGPEAGKEVQTMIANSYKQQNSGVMAIVGVAVLVFGATGVFMALQKSLNRIWDVKPNPKAGLLKMVLDRSTSFGMILGIGFLLLISLVITSGLTALSDWISGHLPDFLLYIFYVINFVFSIAVVTVLFAMIFKFIPDVKVEWKSVWSGAIFTAVLFEIGKFGLGLYFGNTDPASSYGAAGSLILMLLWIYYSCLILFYGAEFTQVYARHHGHNLTPSSYAVPISGDKDKNTI